MYQYDDLPRPQRAIRLLKIMRASAQEGQLSSILCKIAIWYLEEDKPDYYAISYTWGDTSPEVPVLVRKEGKDNVLLVPQNCEKALQQAWHCKQDAWYWIDSICID